jgi:hypothetical protein
MRIITRTKIMGVIIYKKKLENFCFIFPEFMNEIIEIAVIYANIFVRENVIITTDEKKQYITKLILKNFVL